MNQSDAFLESVNNDPAFVAKAIFDLHCLLQKQAEALYLFKGITFPVVVSSSILYLANVEKASLTQIAKALNIPHQLAAQRVKILLKHQLIDSTGDPQDKRRTYFQLNQQGLEQAQSLALYCKDAGHVFCELSKEVGVDLLAIMNKVQQSLRNKSFGERFDQDKPDYIELVHSGKPEINHVQYAQNNSDEIFRIRQSVFQFEQGVKPQRDFDGSDNDATHLLVNLNGVNVATGRITQQGQIGRVAVLRIYRGKGIGQALVTKLIEIGKSMPYNKLSLSAQSSAIPFYQKLGFTTIGTEYMDAGMAHIKMELVVSE